MDCQYTVAPKVSHSIKHKKTQKVETPQTSSNNEPSDPSDNEVEHDATLHSDDSADNIPLSKLAGKTSTESPELDNLLDMPKNEENFSYQKSWNQKVQTEDMLHLQTV